MILPGFSYDSTRIKAKSNQNQKQNQNQIKIRIKSKIKTQSKSLEILVEILGKSYEKARIGLPSKFLGSLPTALRCTATAPWLRSRWLLHPFVCTGSTGPPRPGPMAGASRLLPPVAPQGARICVLGFLGVLTGL